MNGVIIGIIYGIVWYSFNIFTGRYIATKTQNMIISGIVPLLITVPILLSVILFKPLVDDWQTFIQTWWLSFLAGALIIKFSVFNRLYK